MKIFLIGFMGSGKTTLGRKLAARMNYEFIDLDHMLEKQVELSIAEYFQFFGEDSFRKKESEILKKTVYPENAVISTGGGLPCYFDNMGWMKANGKVVYLQLPPKTLADRLETGKEERPLLQDKHGDDLIAFIETKLAEREPFYTQANIIADGLSLTAEKLEEILLVENN
ncbi:MAG TPA: shikimate kinase [Mucilaginibacter sp.]|nr:shikimate kinase [Mucilaginibacter sp.]